MQRLPLYLYDWITLTEYVTLSIIINKANVIFHEVRLCKNC